MTFDDLVSAPELRRAIAELGWERPTPIQSQAIPPARAGRDVVGIAQTGTGKTAAFLLPALERQLHREGLHTLVLCPTRELARQVADDARALARHTELWVGALYGGVPVGPQARDLRAGFDLLVATPGRLIDHLERGTADLRAIEVLVLDEADRMLDMGFRPQIERILRACPPGRQTLLYSATMPHGVHALALRILRDPAWIAATPHATVADGVRQVVYSVRPDRKPDLLVELLRQPGLDQVLVFARTRHGADTLAARLRAAGIGVALLHGERDMRERHRALDHFARGAVRVLVATDIAQRGLDIEGISHVVNYDVPQNPEDYVHRIGRTARAGASGTAITFMTAADLGAVHAIERALGQTLERISIPGYDFAGTPAPRPREPGPRPRGRGHRLGTRRPEELTPEELDALLDVG